MVVNYFGLTLNVPDNTKCLCADSDGGVYACADPSPSWNAKAGTWCSHMKGPFTLVEVAAIPDPGNSLRPALAVR